MNVVYSSSDSYAEICGVSLVSLLENNKDADEIIIFIIDNDISQINKTRLFNTVSQYKRKLVFVPKVDLEKVLGINVYVGRWNIGTFFRLYLGSILPENIAKVIYLDCDTIVRHPLSDVYNLDLGNAVVAGVDDCRSDLYRVDIDIKPGSIYINNGFLLMDLSKIRKENIEQEFNKYIAYCKGDCTYMDQAPLNHVLSSNGRIYQLPAKYNAQRIFFDFTFDELMKLRKPNFHLSKEEYDEAINDPIVVHFTPVFISGTRPRQKKDKHKFTPEYRHYKSISEWKEIPYRNDDRKIPKKIMTIICKLTPRKLMIKIMSYLHATWYPNKRINKRKKLGY